MQILRDRQFDWVIITSPESAAVFIAGWQAAGRPKASVKALHPVPPLIWRHMRQYDI